MPPISHIFTDLSKVEQNEAQAFGPVVGAPELKFNLTNVFSKLSGASGKLPAYAMTDGVLFIVPQKPAIVGEPISLVNIFLKPDKAIDLGVKIKYFVYRSIKIGDLFVSNGVDYKLLQQNNGNLLPFMIKIWEEYQEFNIGVNSTVAFNAKKVGFNDDELKSYKDFFSKGEYNFPKIKIGETIGSFDDTFGFEVVVDEGDFVQEHSDTGFEFKDDFFRAKQCILNVDTLPANINKANIYGNLPNIVGERIFRESVYFFLDPAAYYGSHVTINNDKNEGIIITPVKECKKPSEIHTVCLNFFNNNKTYLYIKSKRGRSYNFYPSVPLVPKPIEIPGNQNTSFNDSQWPIRILDVKNYLSLTLNIFSKNCLMIHNIGIKNKNIYKSEDLLFGWLTPTPSAKTLGFVLPGIYPNKKIPSIIYLSYDNGQEVQHNNLFGRVNLETIFEREDFEKGTNNISYVNHLRSVLINEGDDVSLYNTKLILEGDNISQTIPTGSSSSNTELRTYILFPQKTTKTKKIGDKDVPIVYQSVTAGYIPKDDENYVNNIYGGGEIWRGIIKDGAEEIKSLLYRRKDNDEDLPIYQLGITHKVIA